MRRIAIVAAAAAALAWVGCRASGGEMMKCTGCAREMKAADLCGACKACMACDKVHGKTECKGCKGMAGAKDMCAGCGLCKACDKCVMECKGCKGKAKLADGLCAKCGMCMKCGCACGK